MIRTVAWCDGPSLVYVAWLQDCRARSPYCTYVVHQSAAVLEAIGLEMKMLTRRYDLLFSSSDCTKLGTADCIVILKSVATVLV